MNTALEILAWIVGVMIVCSLLFAGMFGIGMLNDYRRSRKFERAHQRLIREERQDP